MRLWKLLALGVLAVAGAGLALEDAWAQRTPPYFASITASKARMRTGPGLEYPASWLYQREDLPIKVIDVYGDWRKIEDPDGTQGWMQVKLLSDTRTAMVLGGSSRCAPRRASTRE
ncbi:MAG: SH3 domain-containing protein [Sphingomonas sp.]